MAPIRTHLAASGNVWKLPVAFRCDQDDAFVVLAIGEAEAEEFGHERTNLFFGEIDHTGDLAADQAFGRVIFGDLG